jgi:tetratricopeptide (TPR) repeat protein
MKAPRAFLAVTLGVLGAIAVPASAQFRPGHIGGVVKDEEGGPIRGAVIVAQNKEATPPSLTAVSDEKGRFGILGLRSGLWSVMVKAPGFEPQVLSWPVRAQTMGPSIDIVLVAIPGGLPSIVFDKLKASSVVEDLDKASALLDSGRADEAIEIYRALLVKAPSLTSLNLAIGRAYRVKKEPQRAVESYRTLLETDPANVKVRLELGMALGEAGQGEAAASEFERIIRESPDTPTSVAARTELDRLRK